MGKFKGVYSGEKGTHGGPLLRRDTSVDDSGTPKMPTRRDPYKIDGPDERTGGYSGEVGKC